MEGDAGLEVRQVGCHVEGPGLDDGGVDARPVVDGHDLDRLRGAVRPTFDNIGITGVVG